MAPVFMGAFEGSQQGAHEWVVSFRKAPDNLEAFADALDQTLIAENSDYADKHRNNFALRKPIVTVVPAGTFEALLRKDGRVGGQIKIPRLSNERAYVERLKAFAEEA